MTQQTEGPQKPMNKDEAMNVARRLVQEAVDIANSAGVDPLLVVAPHCPDIDVKDNSADDRESKNLIWSGIPVIIDNSTDGLFEMTELNDDLEQKPSFLVTQATADLVRPDFERYRPSLERMAEDWQEEKNRFMQEQANRIRDDKKSVKRSNSKRQ